MLATQNVKTTNYPAFINSFKERKPEPGYQEILKAKQPAKAQTTIEGLTFNPEEIVASSQNLGWQTIKVFLVRHEGTEIKAKSLLRHCVVLQLDNSHEIEVFVAGQTIKRVLRHGELMIFPAGSSAEWRWREGKPNEALYFFLEPAFLETIAENFDFAQPVTIEPAIGVEDEQLRYLALSLSCEMNDSNILGHFYAEVLANAFAMQTVRRFSHLREVNLTTQGGMAPFKLRKALGFIDENLECEEELSLEIVAGKVGMSYFHFSRTFKQSMGVSPNNYMVARRIERAKKLLAQTNAGIADIALQVGFASQSHFTTVFRRLTGTTPKIFRRTL